MRPHRGVCLLNYTIASHHCQKNISDPVAHCILIVTTVTVYLLQWDVVAVNEKSCILSKRKTLSSYVQCCLLSSDGRQLHLIKLDTMFIIYWGCSILLQAWVLSLPRKTPTGYRLIHNSRGMKHFVYELAMAVIGSLWCSKRVEGFPSNSLSVLALSHAWVR